MKNYHKQTIIPPMLGILILCAFLISQLGLTILGNKLKVLGTTSDLEVSEIISLINVRRQEQGVKPLQINDRLTIAAQEKAKDMIQFSYWDHFSPSKRPPWSFILDAGYDYRYAGENLAKDFDNSNTLVDKWMESPPHRANILNSNYEDTGVAIIKGELEGKEATLIVQMFGAPFHLTSEQAEQLKQEPIINIDGEALIGNKDIDIAVLANNNRFLITKIIAISIVVTLILILIVDLLKKMKYLNTTKRLSKKYWGHLLFLIMLGTLVWLTNPNYKQF